MEKKTKKDLVKQFSYKLSNAVCFVDRTPETRTIYLEEKGVTLSLTKEFAVISRLYSKNVYAVGSNAYMYISDFFDLYFDDKKEDVLYQILLSTIEAVVITDSLWGYGDLTLNIYEKMLSQFTHLLYANAMSQEEREELYKLITEDYIKDKSPEEIRELCLSLLKDNTYNYHLAQFAEKIGYTITPQIPADDTTALDEAATNETIKNELKNGGKAI